MSRQVSPDGLYYWDGNQWLTNVVNSARTERQPASWTKPLQVAIGVWYAAQALYAASQPFWYIATMTQYANAMNQHEQAINPGGPSLPPDAFTNTFETIMFGAGIVLAIGLSAVVLVAVVRRWRWAYYVILALLVLQALGSGLGLVSTLGLSALTGQYAGPPAWMIAEQVISGLVAGALAVWMVIAAVQRGPWGMQKVVVPS